MDFKLFIIIVNWNLKSDTIACIQSLKQAGADLEKIIVVDNGSVDGSVADLRKQFHDALQIIEVKANLGFAAGANLGIRKAMQQGAEWLLLINNDTWVATDFITELSTAIQSRPDISVFGPAIYYANNTDKIWYLGERLIPGTMLTINHFRGKPLPANLSVVLPVDFLSGCCMIVSRKAFEDIGLLDANLFMYGEEVDWCWRARRAGHHCAAIPSAVMWHKISASSNCIPSNTLYLRIRNQIWEYRRYGNIIQHVLLIAFTLFRILIINVHQKNSLRLSWRGWIDGWCLAIPPINETIQS